MQRKTSHDRRRARTDLNGRNAEATRLEDDADAAGRDALAEAAHHAASDQHVLHLAGNLGSIRRRRRPNLYAPRAGLPRVRFG